MNQAPVMEPPPLPLPYFDVGETAFAESRYSSSMASATFFRPRLLGAGEEVVGPGLIGTETPRDVGKGLDDGAGERGGVDGCVAPNCLA